MLAGDPNSRSPTRRQLVFTAVGVLLGGAVFGAFVAIQVPLFRTPVSDAVNSTLIALMGTIAAAALAGAGAAWAAQWTVEATIRSAELSAKAAADAALEQRKYEDRHRLTLKRQELLVSLWQTADRLKRECEAQQHWRYDQLNDIPGRRPELHDSEPIREAWKALQILSPGHASIAARALYDATVRLHDVLWVEVTELVGDESPADPVNERRWDDAIALWDAAANDFLEAAAGEVRDPA